MEAGGEVNDSPTEVWSAGTIDVDRYATELEHRIIGLLLIFEIELVGKARTAAIGDTDTKPVSGTLIARQQFFDLLNSVVSEL